MNVAKVLMQKATSSLFTATLTARKFVHCEAWQNRLKNIFNHGARDANPFQII